MRAAAIVLAAMLLAGCASLPKSPPVPITSMSQIAGKWQGTITSGFSGPEQLYYLTIHPDGGTVAQWGLNWQWGKITLAGGSAAFEGSGDVSTATVTLYEAPRSLTMNSTFGNWSVYVTPAR
jgi:hypothetical protein